MTPPKPNRATDRSVALALLRIAFSPLVVRTVLFFSLFMVILLTLVFKFGFRHDLLWKLPILLFVFSAALAFRSLWNNKSFKVEGPTVYDKAEYHYDGDFPKGLPSKQAFVHTGMFVGWLIEHDMIAEGFLEETQGFKERKVTGPQVYKAWDGTLTSDVLTDEGNAFAGYYYNGAEGQDGPYFEDYEAVLVKALPDIYHVKDTWENYDTIKKKIDERYDSWRNKIDGRAK